MKDHWWTFKWAKFFVFSRTGFFVFFLREYPHLQCGVCRKTHSPNKTNAQGTCDKEARSSSAFAHSESQTSVRTLAACAAHAVPR
jgi:hypothetical protein